jgi:threonine dehydrogenase-like Zn-dependent dehydrogenase
MKVPFIVGPNALELREIDAPVAGPRDAVLEVAMVGVCGTDLGLISLGGAGGRPTPLGHELSGTVVETGDQVTSVKVGDRVVLNPLPNMIGNGGPEGGFADRLLVRDLASNPGSLLALPEAMSFEQGALVEPLAVAVHATNRLGARPGDRVAIFGAGPIGLAVLAMLKYRGVDDVVVFELSPYRRGCAERLGARAVFDPAVKPAQESLIELHGQAGSGPLAATSHYVEATGAPIMPDLILNAAPRSTICVVALHKQPETVLFGPVMFKELTIIGTMGYPDEFSEALEVAGSGMIDLDAFVSHRIDGAEILDAFDVARQPDSSAKVLVKYR